MTAHRRPEDAGWAFAEHDAAGLGGALARFLDSLGTRPRMLGLGEPVHGEEEFPLLRNQILRYLVEHEGYRSIAIESDCLVARTVEAFVGDGQGSAEEALRTGFSHGFGESAANRELVDWLREHNRDAAARDRVRFYAFDAPMEVAGANSPRHALTALHTYLAANLDAARLPCAAATIDRLLGADERWRNPAAMLDAAESVGASAEAGELRLLTDDLTTLLFAESPRLITATSADQYWLARLHARTAAGLLRYHAAMADPAGTRVARMLGLRDAMMAENLTAIASREAGRGATLVFAHNRHLQRDLSEWRWEDQVLHWWSAGAILGAQLDDQYAFLASALGSAPGRGVAAPPPDTLEGALSALPGQRYVVNAARLATVLGDTAPPLATRTDTAADPAYFPLDPGHLRQTDGIVFVRDLAPGPAPPGRH